MKDRQVTEHEVNETITDPDSVKRDIKGRKNSYKFINDRFLRVTHKDEVNHLLVITVTIRKKPFKR
jgi:hypothetical protein